MDLENKIQLFERIKVVHIPAEEYALFKARLLENGTTFIDVWDDQLQMHIFVG